MSKLAGGILGVSSKDLVQLRVKSGCRTSERMTLEAKIDTDMMMSE